MNWFVADREEYRARRKDLARAYREIICLHYPAMTVVEVAGFVEDGARVEIETTAVIPV